MPKKRDDSPLLTEKQRFLRAGAALVFVVVVIALMRAGFFNPVGHAVVTYSLDSMKAEQQRQAAEKRRAGP